MPPFVETLCALTALAASGNFSSYLMASWHKDALVAVIAAAISEAADVADAADASVAAARGGGGGEGGDAWRLVDTLPSPLPARRYLREFDNGSSRRLDDPEQLARSSCPWLGVLLLRRVGLTKYIPAEYLARGCEACCNALIIGDRTFDDEDKNTFPHTKLASLEVARLPGQTLVETGDCFGRFHIPVERPDDPDFDYIEEFACLFEPSSSPDEASALINLFAFELPMQYFEQWIRQESIPTRPAPAHPAPPAACFAR
ncbi:hypothetical protein HK405_000721 [Cladochytrium tenue]|nr:hypothetical protein HK405_000721 [Cladochytrium tenue]